MIQEYVNKVTITHIILISLILHAFVIAQPQFLQIWDESIFIELMRDFLKGEDHVPYQLPGVNLFQGTATLIFGDNWFSWRVPSVIFGMLSLFVFYKVFCNYTNERNALLATTILSFDTIFFVHSTLFLRDIPLMFFGIFSFYLYIKKRYYLASLVLGFSFLIKETALFFLFLIMINHYVSFPKKIRMTNLKKGIIFSSILISSFLIPLSVYDMIYQPIIYEPIVVTQELPDGREVPISYPKLKVMESRGYVKQTPVGVINNPVEHLNVFFSKGYLSSEAYKIKNWETNPTNYPYSWVLPIPLPENANSLGWVKEDLFDETYSGVLHVGKVFGIEWRGDPNQPLWIIGFWSSVGLVAYGIIKQRDKTTLFLASGIITMYVPYLILQFTGRVMFPYYFILTVPFLSFGVVLALDKIKNHTIRFVSKAVFLFIVIIWFVYFYPLKIL